MAWFFPRGQLDNGISNPTLHKATIISDAVPCFYIFTTTIPDQSPLQGKHNLVQLKSKGMIHLTASHPAFVWTTYQLNKYMAQKDSDTFFSQQVPELMCRVHCPLCRLRLRSKNRSQVSLALGICGRKSNDGSCCRRRQRDGLTIHKCASAQMLPATGWLRALPGGSSSPLDDRCSHLPNS